MTIKSFYEFNKISILVLVGLLKFLCPRRRLVLFLCPGTSEPAWEEKWRDYQKYCLIRDMQLCVTKLLNKIYSIKIVKIQEQYRVRNKWYLGRLQGTWTLYRLHFAWFYIILFIFYIPGSTPLRGGQRQWKKCYTCTYTFTHPINKTQLCRLSQI